MMKLNTFISCVIILSCLFLWSCGGGGSEQASDSPSTEESTNEDGLGESEASELSEETETVAESEPEPASEEAMDEDLQVIEGTFSGIEEGDYYYILVSNEDGENQSFMVLDSNEFFDNLYENSDENQGRKIKLYWKESVENIEQAGGEMTVTKYVKAEWLD